MLSGVYWDSPGVFKVTMFLGELSVMGGAGSVFTSIQFFVEDTYHFILCL